MKGIIIALIVLPILVGASYAWWTDSQVAEQTIKMGKLKIEADFPEQNLDAQYEPGIETTFNGEIRNTGTIPVIVKIENDSQIEKKYGDDVWTPIPDSQQKFEQDTLNLVQLTFEPTSQNYADNENAYWFTNQLDTSERYLLLDAGATVAVTNYGSLSAQMGNRYNEATIKIRAKIKGTQVMDGAIANELGISPENLVGLENSQTIKARSFQNSTQNRADKKLKELLNRE